MICYKDRTFCVAECANTQCGSKLTDEVKFAASYYGLPLSLSDLSGNCELFIEVKDAHRS